MKKNINRLKQNKIFNNLLLFSLLFSLFFSIDVVFRIIYDKDVVAHVWYKIVTNVFTISYALMFAFLIYFLPKKIGKRVLIIISIIFYTLVIIQSFHFQILGRFLGVDDIFLASEGTAYINTLHHYINYKIFILVAGCILLEIIILRLFNTERLQGKYIRPIIISCFLFCYIIRCITFNVMGSSVSFEDTWDAWNNDRNVYNEFSDNNRSFYLTGLYEYTFHDIYLSLKALYKNNNKEYLDDLDQYFNTNNITLENNTHTGILKDKNLIIIHMESIDSWLVNDEYMPNLNKLTNEGINFTNRFAPIFGPGATFADEFTINTSIYNPVRGKSANFYGKNDFANSLPNLFKQNGYSVNSIHENTGSFYNRTSMHLALGYENHYALMDMGFNYNNLIDDRYLVTNDDIYNLIINKENKFMTFITTYSGHMPYDNTNSLCKGEYYNKFVSDNKELSCIKTLSHMTDEFIGILVNRLEEDNLLDDTVLVFVTDHYMYGYSNTDELLKIKNAKNGNMATQVPFVIWGKNIEQETNNTILDTSDIMPTLFNLFGIVYNPTYYLGTDVYSTCHENYVYFADKSWYDGTNYFDSTLVTSSESDMVKQISKKIKINDDLLKSDYFRYLKKKN